MHSCWPALTSTRSVAVSGGGDGTSAGMSRIFPTKGTATKTPIRTTPSAYAASARRLSIEALQEQAERDDLEPDDAGKRETRVDRAHGPWQHVRDDRDGDSQQSRQRQQVAPGDDRIRWIAHHLPVGDEVQPEQERPQRDHHHDSDGGLAPDGFALDHQGRDDREKPQPRDPPDDVVQGRRKPHLQLRERAENAVDDARVDVVARRTDRRSHEAELRQVELPDIRHELADAAWTALGPCERHERGRRHRDDARRYWRDAEARAGGR